MKNIISFIFAAAKATVIFVVAAVVLVAMVLNAGCSQGKTNIEAEQESNMSPEERLCKVRTELWKLCVERKQLQRRMILRAETQLSIEDPGAYLRWKNENRNKDLTASCATEKHNANLVCDALKCPLCDAASEGNTAEMKRLLDGGANPNQAEKNGKTALMRAALFGHVEIAKMLLDGGANPNQAEKNGWPALMTAAYWGHAEVVKVLLDGGANPNQANKDGKTALMWATFKKHAEVVRILRAAGAK